MDIESVAGSRTFRVISPYLYMTPCKEDNAFSAKVNPFTLNNPDQGDANFSKPIKRPSHISKFEVDPNTTACTVRSKLKRVKCNPFTKKPEDFNSHESWLDKSVDREAPLELHNEASHLTFLRENPAIRISAEPINLMDIVRIDDQQLNARESHSSTKAFICKYCGDMFSSGCALGGHISKSHRGLSKVFHHKKLRFHQRKIERERSQYLRLIRQESESKKQRAVPLLLNQLDSTVADSTDLIIYGQQKEASN